jgi:anti-sigma factor RsiW
MTMHEDDSPVERPTPVDVSANDRSHPEWTDQLSDYLDDELTDDERRAVERHVRQCAACAAVLSDLRRVVEAAGSLLPTPPGEHVWQAVSAQVRAMPSVSPAIGRRLSFTMPQLVAASVLLALLSGWAALRLMAPQPVDPAGSSASVSRPAAVEAVNVGDFEFNDPRYDAAVSELQQALERDRGRLDPETVATVESDLRIIDQALDDARRALINDPANSYLSGHVADTRQRKLDLLRRAAALATDSQM